MTDDGPTFWTSVKQTAWLVVLLPFLLLLDLLSSVGHMGKRSGFTDDKN